MQERLKDWLRSFFPAPLSVGPKEWGRAVIGVGLVVLPMVSIGLWLFGGPVTLHIVAPAGASAVILFSASSSPFAQPWSVLGGNIIATTIGVALGLSALPTVAAAVLAVCLAIGCLFLLRCMHPPSCALAMVAAIGGPGISELGYGLLVPVGFNSLLLIAAALVYNNLTHHPYPKPRTSSSDAERPSVPLGEARMSFTGNDVDRALEDFGEIVDITRDDLVELIKRTETHAIRRSMGRVTAGDIMCRELHWIGPGARIRKAWQTIRQHRLHSLAVVEPDSRELVGIITLTDLLQHFEPSPSRLNVRRLTFNREARVERLMSAPVVSVQEGAHLTDLVHLLADRGMSCLPVVDAEQRLVGMITQSDLVAGLYQNWMKRLGE
ncbi:HPP family protein [Stutzerimonas zhaodongensis]|uniref:HPP family protein n=1 Tax=Stutzerimonas zhaodongensis TaxID=1176257 RepID=A0A3M2HU66_9GAMM|nr:HPP family protein [Stutzerimonas zhaodongensis]MCQ4314966.1 HPP family protein [Stutzerimonas zhaodongensis]RMH90442.1 HPP family protein [Stutzerimonas zhaodongensis]